jgi:hypothetical protein
MSGLDLDLFGFAHPELVEGAVFLGVLRQAQHERFWPGRVDIC